MTAEEQQRLRDGIYFHLGWWLEDEQLAGMEWTFPDDPAFVFARCQDGKYRLGCIPRDRLEDFLRERDGWMVAYTGELVWYRVEVDARVGPGPSRV
jgi:hypothetical protein